MPGASSVSVAPPLCTHNTWGSYMTSSQPSQLLFFSLFPLTCGPSRQREGRRMQRKTLNTPCHALRNNTGLYSFCLLLFFSLLFLFGVFLQTKCYSERSSRHFDFKHAAMQPCGPPPQLPTFSLVALVLIFSFEVFKKMSKYNKTKYF